MKVYIYEYKICSPSRAHHTNMFKDGFAWCRTAGMKQMNKLEFDKYIKYIKATKQSAKFSRLKDGSFRVRYFDMRGAKCRN